ncbi:mitochondrial import receptor subunit tom-22 [Gaeumannomyces tritici R3-111a-1]|uniref:Mitochondrial import receptor subunit tom-22 n=1 Tax=Gaeumannomyces tritici (strain R3-111a-1) TaxID=644352 RepID=J3NIB9_GAET3|nr:mitochondrial import receptor subunit tom-22 [Gaeumannomyces tritici R3-111a-1]EJT81012.1 mitochondrial import receptor subunit tom-22 [Gaeumannomyces tritici R3-111a-1]
MVQLTEVVDEEFSRTQPGPEEDEDDFTDTDSEISTDSDFNATVESLSDRLYALRDMVPPTARGWMYSRWMGANRFVRTGAAFLGKAAWHVSVSALLFGVPFALLWNEEQNMIAMEQEQRMREMGGELLTAGGERPEGDTVNQLEAALGGGGIGSVAAKPSL